MLEDNYMGELHAIESAIAATYRNNPELKDVDVLKALDAANTHFRRKAKGLETTTPDLEEGSVMPIFENIMKKVEAYKALTGGDSEKKEKSWKPLSMRNRDTPERTFANCVSKVKKSVKRHSAIHGKRGYLNFIIEYAR